MELIELMKSRHSVRQYKDQKIEDDKRHVLNELISKINRETGLNIQIFYDEDKCFNSFMAHYGKFEGVCNYIALVGKKTKDLEEKLGYYGEEIVLKVQEIGLNTCFVALTHGKSKAIVNKGEKQVCLITIGYGLTQGIPHKSKKIEEVSNYTNSSPKWFLNAVEACLLAPTAMNQQKFYIELSDNNKVNIKAKKGFYTKLDLGIVKYHFQIISNCVIDN